MAQTTQTKYIDLNGLSHFYDNFKEYVASNFLLRKSYDLTNAESLDGDLSVNGLMSYDSTKGSFKVSGTVTIALSRTTSCNVTIGIKDMPGGVSITAYGSSYISDSSVYFNVKDVSEVSFTVNGECWLSSISIEESSTKIPDKVSELLNDRGYVISGMTGETLKLNI